MAGTAIANACNGSHRRCTSMSTLWEMAATLRAEADVAVVPRVETRPRQAALVDIAVPGRVEYWCRLLGTTPLRLCCAVEEVGDDPTAVRRFLARHRSN